MNRDIAKKNYNLRIKKLLSHLKPNQAFLLSNPADITYFTEFDQFLLPQSRESLAIISNNNTVVFHSIFTTFKKRPDVVYIQSCQIKSLINFLSGDLIDKNINELFIDANSLTVEEYLAIKQVEQLKTTTFDKNWLWQQRMIKSDSEIRFIKKAISITKTALKNCILQIRVGISEKQLLELLLSEMKKLGAQGESFPSIVAFGVHTALPHHQPTNKKLKINTPILIDCGAKFNNYCSDMTRTFWHGDNPEKKFINIERVVKEAYNKTAKLIKNASKNKGLVSAWQLDQAARQTISTAGFGSKFIHTTGHGLGLEIHEPPSLSSQNQTQILPNMAITIEPGIYLTGQFGYRHENTIIVE